MGSHILSPASGWCYYLSLPLVSWPPPTPSLRSCLLSPSCRLPLTAPTPCVLHREGGRGSARSPPPPAAHRSPLDGSPPAASATAPQTAAATRSAGAGSVRCWRESAWCPGTWCL